MIINPKALTKILKELVKNAPLILEGIERIKKILLKNRKKNITESEPLSEDISPTNTDIFRNSLRQHVKVINRHSKVLTEHNTIIEEITTQSENLAVQSKNLATLVNVLIWTTGISFVIAVIAILIALFK